MCDAGGGGVFVYMNCHGAHKCVVFFFFFNDTATTEIYTLSLHDALPIYLKIHVSLLALVML